MSNKIGCGSSIFLLCKKMCIAFKLAMLVCVVPVLCFVCSRNLRCCSFFYACILFLEEQCVWVDVNEPTRTCFLTFFMTLSSLLNLILSSHLPVSSVCSFCRLRGLWLRETEERAILEII